MTARLVTFEGIDGAGKSSLMAVVAEHLRAAGLEVLTTREPGGTEVGAAIRTLVLHPPSGSTVSAWTEALLMLADRAQHVAEVIAPNLVAGTWVLCDRFHDSTIAYQGYGRALADDDLERLMRLCHLAVPLMPWRTVWVDTPLSLARQRREGRRGDAIEDGGEAFLARVRTGFAALAAAEPERFLIVDGTRPLAELAAEVGARLLAEGEVGE